MEARMEELKALLKGKGPASEDSAGSGAELGGTGGIAPGAGSAAPIRLWDKPAATATAVIYEGGQRIGQEMIRKGR
ncbi:hypothetical protein KSP40_PGU012475 [Platanthera guangdongensis]|uniref:Uncharacterized protein n=1 Tax=Platanthera guangdongensis TaxID=2320717 RepID=A0ABR2MQF5_9ASPA